MIYVFMRGRLGNQLFQYAFARMLQMNNPSQTINYIFDDVEQSGEKSEGWENSLIYFNTFQTESSKCSKIRFSLIQKLILRFYWRKYPHNGSIEQKHLYQMKYIDLMNRFGLYYLDLGYYDFSKVIHQNVFISGNFESEKYFSSIYPIILKEITPKYPVLKHNEVLLNKIRSCNSVCITIRRGDFVENPHFSKLLNVCTPVYFRRAINVMKQLTQSPVFFFFSDDIEWVKNNLKFENIECYYEKGTDPIWEKLRLMYSCNHFIISNSTFSWWAQYLGRCSEKVVIAPERWYNSDFQPDLFQSNWHLLKVD